MNILTKLLTRVKEHQKDVFLAFCIALIALIGYNLGKINALKKMPITITDRVPQERAMPHSENGEADVYSSVGDKDTAKDPANAKAVIDRRVVVSKNSDKYHFTWCSGAKRIKEENKLWFDSEAAAQAAGYVKAGNCD